MSEQRQSPLTDRAIRESLAERDAPDELARSISDLAPATPQQSAPGVLGWPFLRPVFGDGQRLVFALVLIGLLVALGVAALLGSRPSAVRRPALPVLLVTAAPAGGPVLPAGWNHAPTQPHRLQGVGPEMDGLLVLVNAKIGDLGFLDPARGEGGEIVERLDVGSQVATCR